MFIHARERMRARILARELDYYNRLEELAARHALPLHVVAARPSNRRAAADSPHLHVFAGGPPLTGRHVLHVCPTYVHGFWYTDPIGTRRHSAIGAMTFDPATIDAQGAAHLLARLQRDNIAGNRSKYPQQTGSADLPPGGIAIFAQEQTPEVVQNAYLDLATLIETVIRHRGQRPVWIKPHPLQRPKTQAMIHAFHDPERDVHVTGAGVHDLLAACAFNVSQSSAVAMEGFMHEKPAILAGSADFHHNTLTVRSTDELAQAMARISKVRFEHAKFLDWFLMRNCLEPASPDFTDRLATRISATGFPLR